MKNALGNRLKADSRGFYCKALDKQQDGVYIIGEDNIIIGQNAGGETNGHKKNSARVR